MKYKSWQDKRHTWNRRVIMFKESYGYRLKFEEMDYGIYRRTYSTIEACIVDYDAFKSGTTIKQLKDKDNAKD